MFTSTESPKRSLCERHEAMEHQSLYPNTSFNHIDIDSTYDQPEFLPTVLSIPTMADVPDTDLGVGSIVVVNVPESSENLHGVIRWIGNPVGAKNILIGVELDDDYVDKQLPTTNGEYHGVS